jgi:multiple sugar transport system substrate-binding protein
MHANIQKMVNFLLLGMALVGGGAGAQTPVSVWVHAGPGPERDVYVASVKAFNESQKDIKVDLVALPEGSYSDQVNAAVQAKSLPCILDFDGPNMYNYAWTKNIIPLDDFPTLRSIKADLLPTLVRQGTYDYKLYSLAQYDSGLAIWGNRKLLTQAGVRIPATVSEAWTFDEFEDALKKLKAMGVAFPLDMKFNYGIGEWYTYGFSPIVQSFGGDLINRKDFKSASGVINGPETVKALGTLQSWVKAGYVNAATKDDSDFVKGRAALSYVGHWTYGDYKKALGDDLVLIPMPKFGNKAVTGAGSWNFGISANCKEPQAAAKVLGYFMSMPEITRVTQANGAIPGTFAAILANKKFFKGGDLEIYAQQIARGMSMVRPQTPAYPTITAAFAEAVSNIVAGADVRAELDKAAGKIDQDIEGNKGYPVK